MKHIKKFKQEDPTLIDLEDLCDLTLLSLIDNDVPIKIRKLGGDYHKLDMKTYKIELLLRTSLYLEVDEIEDRRIPKWGEIKNDIFTLLTYLRKKVIIYKKLLMVVKDPIIQMMVVI